MTKQFLAILLFCCAPFLLINTLYSQEPTYFGGEAGKKLDWTLFYLNSHYVDSTDVDRLAELAVIRMIQELDPFSRYQSKKQLDDQRKADEGYKNDGIGIRYYIIKDTATITYIDETGPGVKAGLRKGDKILSLNKVNTIGQNYDHLKQMIIADRGTVLNFKIKRANEILTIPVTSISLFAASLDAAYPIKNNIGYIRLNRFTMKTIGEVQTALKDLKSQGMEHLILDLRDNRGGVVTGATNLADEFLPADKLIMSSEGKGLPKSEVLATADGLFEKGKLVILTNGATASASEIFTGAMQEWDRALVIGEMTYGKGLIQQSYLLGDSSAVRLTIGRYFTPTGRMLQRPYQFDTTKDWIFQNISGVIHYKDFTKALVAHPDNKWKSMSGRALLKGQGGIIPDIYLPKLAEHKPQLKQLNDLGILYKYVTYHVDKFRPYYLFHYKNGNEFRLDKSVDKGIYTTFPTFLMENMANKALAASINQQGISEDVMLRIKAWIAPQIWEVGSYFAVNNEEDAVVQRAIEAIQDKTFQELGIKF
ncbi:MAG: S41 family peptidase [Saprospiraceae bacterium]